jgi:hypothetical protein
LTEFPRLRSSASEFKRSLDSFSSGFNSLFGPPESGVASATGMAAEKEDLPGPKAAASEACAYGKKPDADSSLDNTD